jgi:ABC-type branched-subunit amino acid transport system substrate-binding protein
MSLTRLLSLALALACALPAAHAVEAGVSAQRVVLGMSVPLTGPLAPYGGDLAQGLKLGLAQANAGGGVNGRSIELLVKDDAGQPEHAVANTRALLDAGVLALTGYHGPRSLEAVLPLIEQAGVPLLGAASSAELLREPMRPAVFNLRAGAREEAEAMVLQLDTVGITEVAAIVQDDALGRAGLEGLQFQLTRLALRPTAMVHLPANADPAASAGAAAAACRTTPQALVLSLDARNTLAVIRAARHQGCRPQFYVMSEAGAQLQAGAAAPGELAGVVVSQVVPHPAAMSLPVVADFQRHAVQAGLKPSHPALEGYLYARAIVEALRRCGRDPTRGGLIAALEARPLDLGGYHLKFTPADHRGSRFTEMTIVTQDGKFRR